MKLTSIILIGGQSKRMGHPKYTLKFGEKTVLERIVSRIAGRSDGLVVVASPMQDLPPLQDVIVARDHVQDQGPLMGILTGLQATEGHAEWAFVTGCDMPFVNHALLDLLVENCDPADDIVIPKRDGHFYPLCALYKTRLWRNADRLLAKGERRLLALLDTCNIKAVPEKKLRSYDPDLLCLTNINTPESYEQALERAGLEG